MEAAASASGAPRWWSARPRRAGAARRAQALRAHGRAVGQLLRAVEALSAHRGGTPTRLALALAAALGAPRHDHPTPPSPPGPHEMESQDAEAKTEESRVADVAATGVAEAVSVRAASVQQGASETQCSAVPTVGAHGEAGGGTAAVAPAPLPFAPAEPLSAVDDLEQVASGRRWRVAQGGVDSDSVWCGVEGPKRARVGISASAQAASTLVFDASWQWNPEAAVFSPAAVVASGMEVDAAGGAGGFVLPTAAGQEAALSVGEAVEVHGLLGARALNGRRGRIVRFVEETSRYEVRMGEDKETKGVRAVNLRKVTHATADVTSADWWASSLAHRARIEAEGRQDGVAPGESVAPE